MQRLHEYYSGECLFLAGLCFSILLIIKVLMIWSSLNLQSIRIGDTTP